MPLNFPLFLEYSDLSCIINPCRIVLVLACFVVAQEGKTKLNIIINRTVAKMCLVLICFMIIVLAYINIKQKKWDV